MKESISQWKANEEPESFWGDRIARFLGEHGVKLGYGFLTLIVLAITFYRLSFPSSSGAVGDYQKAFEQMHLLQQTAIEADGDVEVPLSALASILDRHPELEEKYDGPIAQALLIAGKGKLASIYANRLFSRIGELELPNYITYGMGSLSIETGNLPSALGESEAAGRAASLQEGKGRVENLQAFSLFREALLQRKLGNIEEEMRAWDALKKMMNANEEILPFRELFQEGEVSFASYLESQIHH